MVASSADIAALAAGASRDIPVVVAAADTIVANLSGSFGSAIRVSLLAVPDAKFTVYGPRTFERDNGTPVTVTESFALPAGAKAPSYLCIRNGEPDGSRRNSSSTVTLNGVLIVGPSDLNQQVAGFLKPVTFQQNNVIQVQMQGTPGSRLTICGMATDSLAPQLTITAPTPSLITRETQIDAVGVVVEQTAVKITVNGQPASVTPGTAGQTSFTARVPLATEGPNSLAFSAIDAAGNRTDSSRTVIRDTQAPVVTLNSLPDSATVRADSALTVSGTITDLTKVTANVNGQPAAVDSVTHAFSVRIALATGNNFVTVTATDAAGNATSVVRQVTVDNTPPTLTVTGPAESLITKELVAHVTGTATGNSAVSVTINGVAATLSAGGAFSSDVAIAEGANTLTVVARNAAGLSVTATRHVTRDTQAPALGWTTPTDSTITAASTVSVSGTITDATATTLTVNGVAVPVNATTKAYTTTLPLAADGAASITLVATDAAGNTTTQTRTVTRDATPPVLTILAPDSGAVTQAATLVVNGSVNDITKATVTVNGAPLAIAADGGFSGSVTLASGANTLTFVAVDAAGNRTTVTRTLVRDNDAPAVSMSSPSDQALVRTATVTVRGTITDASTVTATLNGVALVIGADRSYQSTIALSEGVNSVTLVATDAAGNATTVVRTVTLDTTAPVLAVSSPADGITVPDASITVAGTASDQSAFGVKVNGSAVLVGGGGAFSSSLALAEGSNAIVVTATDSAGNSTTTTRSVTRQTAEPVDPTLPPNPRTVAPTLNRTVATSQAAATTFLYTGSNPIQTGVAAGTIVPAQAATLRGRVLSRSGHALPGVIITVMKHPEFGATKSRADGWYDLAVNGGGRLTVAFTKPAYLGAERLVIARRQDYTALPDVVLLQPDSVVSVVQLAGATTAQLAQGSVSTDVDGPRHATMIADTGTVATMRLPDGTTQVLNTLSVRMTEFTVGTNGRASMPAPLPPSSAYTYAVELSADEALAVNGRVTFNKPIFTYVENFLGFPVGTPVPLGVYNRPADIFDPATDTWQAQPDGRVIKILSVSGGIATVDANGDGVADTPAQLSALEFTTTELTKLAVAYPAGTSLMRMRLLGFYPYDANFPSKVLGANPVITATPGCASAQRDVIKCDVRNASQSVAIPGTPLSLAYNSARSEGAADRTIRVPLIGATVPDNLYGVRVRITVAGQVTETVFAPTPNLNYDYTWDGKDAYGRPVQGSPTALVEVGFRFPIQYQVPAAVASSFGLPCSGSATGGTQSCVLDQQNVDSPGETERHSWWRESSAFVKMGSYDAKAQGLGGFDFNVHHMYDPVGRVLYLGDGTTRVADAITPVISTVAGRGLCGLLTDNVKATSSCLIYPAGAANVLAMPDGGFLESDAAEVRRVRPDGIIERYAGNGLSPNDFQTGNDRSHNPDGTIVGEGGPATGTYLVSPGALALGPDGTVYIADNFPLARIERVAPTGVITRVIGLAGGVTPADGVLAHAANIGVVKAMTVGLDGALYFTLGNDVNRIYRLGADSVLRVVAGTGISGVLGDGGPARQARVGDVTSLAVGPDGSLYLGQDDIYTASFRRVRRIAPDGVITTVAGGGGTGADQSTPALEFGFGSVRAIAVSADGTVYAANSDQIEQIGSDGMLRRFAGENLFSQGEKANRFGGDGGPARRAYVNTVTGISAAADGGVLIADYRNGRIRKVAPPMPGFSGAAFIVASDDGSEFYSFDAAGRHLQTVDALTRKSLLVFTYDQSGRLTALRDQDSHTTTIQRDANGIPTAIIGPHGHRTVLVVDPNGQLAAVEPSTGMGLAFAFDVDGLLNGVSNSTGESATYAYDEQGRATSSSGPAGSGAITSVVPLQFGSIATVSTAGGQKITMSYGRDLTGAQTITRETGGTKSTVTSFPDGSSDTRLSDGTLIKSTSVGDPRYELQSPLTSTTTILPSGLTQLRRSGAAVLRNPLDPDEINSETDSTIVNGRVTTAAYDHLTQTGVLTTPAGKTRTLRLNANGRVSSDSVSGLAVRTYDFAPDGQVAAETQDGRTSRFSYDARGRLTQVIGPTGRTRKYFYDMNDNPIGEVTAAGDTVFREFDDHGRLAGVTTMGHTHRMTYTSDNKLASYEMPDVGEGPTVERALYDKDGRTIALIRGSGDSVNYAYDAAGRRTSIRSGSLLRTFTRDTITGRLTSWSEGANRSSFTYDGALLVNHALTGEVAGSVATTYTNNFTPSSQTINGGAPIVFHYDQDLQRDSAGELSIVRDRETGFPLATQIGSVVTSSLFTRLGSTARLGARSGSVTLFDVMYTRDSSDRIVGRTDVVGTDTAAFVYRYDAGGRLSEVTRNGQAAESYSYDPSGNRILAVTSAGLISATYDARDRLLNYGATRFTYSADGFLASRVLGDDTTTYQFTGTGELRSATLPNGNKITYLTDAIGRRIGKKVNGVLQRGWLYGSKYDVVAELDGANNVISRFIYGERDNVPAYLIRGTTKYRLITDDLGSVRLVINVADGSIAQRIDYDAFGRMVVNTNPGFQPFAYAGGVLDPDTQLVHYGAREYDAGVGRWISKDPLLFSANDVNLYAYVGNDPVNLRDASGHFATNSSDLIVAEGEEEKLAEGKTEQDLNKKDDAMKQLCQVTITIAKGAENAHHVVFRVFGGVDDDNLMWIPRDVHMGFHNVVNDMLVAAGMPTIFFGGRDWSTVFDMDPETRNEVKAILLEAASGFDTYCSQFTKKYNGPDVKTAGGPVSMHDIMSRYFDESSDW